MGFSLTAKEKYYYVTLTEPLTKTGISFDFGTPSIQISFGTEYLEDCAIMNQSLSGNREEEIKRTMTDGINNIILIAIKTIEASLNEKNVLIISKDASWQEIKKGLHKINSNGDLLNDAKSFPQQWPFISHKYPD